MLRNMVRNFGGCDCFSWRQFSTSGTVHKGDLAIEVLLYCCLDVIRGSDFVDNTECVVC